MKFWKWWIPISEFLKHYLLGGLISGPNHLKNEPSVRTTFSIRLYSSRTFITRLSLDFLGSTQVSRFRFFIFFSNKPKIDFFKWLIRDHMSHRFDSNLPKLGYYPLFSDFLANLNLVEINIWRLTTNWYQILDWIRSFEQFGEIIESFGHMTTTRKERKFKIKCLKNFFLSLMSVLDSPIMILDVTTIYENLIKYHREKYNLLLRDILR